MHRVDGEEKDEGSLTGAHRTTGEPTSVEGVYVVSREGAQNEGAKMESGKRKSESAREKEHRRGNGVAVRPPSAREREATKMHECWHGRSGGGSAEWG